MWPVIQRSANDGTVVYGLNDNDDHLRTYTFWKGKYTIKCIMCTELRTLKMFSAEEGKIRFSLLDNINGINNESTICALRQWFFCTKESVL
jgi:hypothetical protein